MTDLTTLIATARDFYPKLAANNTKAWWDDNRAVYDDVLKPGAEQLLADLTGPLSDLADAPVKTKLFRPHRDVRFSKDKTPYKTHLHMMWQITGDASQMPVFFFGIGLDYVTAGAGMMGFDKPVLENWRSFADLDHQRISGIFTDLAAKGVSLSEPELKRVPPAFGADHPGADLLRHKGLIGRIALGNTPDLGAAFNTLWPLNALLIQVAES